MKSTHFSWSLLQILWNLNHYTNHISTYIDPIKSDHVTSECLFYPNKIPFGDFPHGCFLKWWYPQNTPKWSFLVEKPMVVGYHHFRNPPHICEEFASTPKLPRLCSCCKKSQGANLWVFTTVRLTVVKPSKYGEIVGPEIPGEHLFT